MDLNINMLEPIEKVITKLIDKISDACGFFVRYKIMQSDAQEQIIKQVISDESLSLDQKLEYVISISSLNKQHKNREKVIEIACENLNAEAKPEDIDDDKLMDIMDKIKNISSYDAQLMWGKLLASEANSPGSISKRLIQNLYLMDQRDAWQFSMFTAFCFNDSIDSDIAHPIVYIRKKAKLYTATFLTTQYIHNLQNWGLIECNYDPGFVFITQKHLVYRGSTYTLFADDVGDNIDAGNIRFTKDGQSLFNLIDKVNDNSILDKTLEAFSTLGIRYEISGRYGVWQSDVFREHHILNY